MITIYKNEAYILIDKIKKDFKSKYKHLELNLTIDEINDLLNGINVTIKANILHTQKSKFINTNGFFSTKDYYDYIMITIDDLFREMINNYYTI